MSLWLGAPESSHLGAPKGLEAFGVSVGSTWWFSSLPKDPSKKHPCFLGAAVSGHWLTLTFFRSWCFWLPVMWLSSLELAAPPLLCIFFLAGLLHPFLPQQPRLWGAEQWRLCQPHPLAGLCMCYLREEEYGSCLMSQGPLPQSRGAK